MGKCNFQEKWLEQKDSDGHKISTWCRKFDNDHLFCICCDKKISIAKGFYAIEQHVKTAVHKIKFKRKIGPGQLRLEIVPQLQPSCENNNTNSSQAASKLKLFSISDQATKAELIWTMRTIAFNQSLNSCDGIKATFQAMFPGMPTEFCLSPKKMSYLITEALGPYFQKKMLNEIQGQFYTLCYDETVNKGGRKELETLVRFWSEKEKKIVSRHLSLTFMGHATGDDLVRNIKHAIDQANLSFRQLLMLGADGPNVNKKVFRIINEEVKTIRQKGLINIGSCNIHIIHNSFLKGLDKFGFNCPDLLIAIKQFFKDKPSRWEDYSKIQVEESIPANCFIKHVPSRWLTLSDAAKRLLEQWPAVLKCFLSYIPKKQSEIERTNTYKTIIKFLKKRTMKAEVMFVASSANIFTKFTGTFQKNEPLIHVLYTELKLLLSTIMSRFCKPVALEKIGRVSSQELFNIDMLLDLSNTNVGGDTLDHLNEIKLPDRERLEFYNAARQHYIAACKHILEKTCLGDLNSILKCFRCLQPNLIKSKGSTSDLIKICRSLPFDVPLDVVTDEWRLLQFESHNLQAITTPLRIDQFWETIFEIRRDAGEFKYPLLKKVVKCALSLTHGNADVERQFSRSGRIVTLERSLLSERMLNAILITSDALKFYENKVECVPIDQELIILAKSAHKSYVNYLTEVKKKEEDEKKATEEEKRKINETLQANKKAQSESKVIDEMELTIREQEKEQNFNSKINNKLLKEANQKLKAALQKGDLIEANVAQILLEKAQELKENELTKKKETEDTKRKVEKRKSTLLDSFINSKKSKP